MQIFHSVKEDLMALMREHTAKKSRIDQSAVCLIDNVAAIDKLAQELDKLQESFTGHEQRAVDLHSKWQDITCKVDIASTQHTLCRQETQTTEQCIQQAHETLSSARDRYRGFIDGCKHEADAIMTIINDKLPSASHRAACLIDANKAVAAQLDQCERELLSNKADNRTAHSHLSVSLADKSAAERDRDSKTAELQSLHEAMDKAEVALRTIESNFSLSCREGDTLESSLAAARQELNALETDAEMQGLTMQLDFLREQDQGLQQELAVRAECVSREEARHAETAHRLDALLAEERSMKVSDVERETASWSEATASAQQRAAVVTHETSDSDIAAELLRVHDVIAAVDKTSKAFEQQMTDKRTHQHNIQTNIDQLAGEESRHADELSDVDSKTSAIQQQIAAGMKLLEELVSVSGRLDEATDQRKAQTHQIDNTQRELAQVQARIAEMEAEIHSLDEAMMTEQKNENAARDECTALQRQTDGTFPNWESELVARLSALDARLKHAERRHQSQSHVSMRMADERTLSVYAQSEANKHEPIKRQMETQLERQMQQAAYTAVGGSFDDSDKEATARQREANKKHLADVSSLALAVRRLEGRRHHDQQQQQQQQQRQREQ
ncbi:unnamed protein product [Vitrella brassicaformis CCMP3155]|uniref:Uncharacterized protein n=1 Tax=Vitrella brassicaformis (strain CCMP3155) TaxID=1169540 RepID=A0A0G4GES4_VITBC|nr:unnamed protein product [Vitrella brassicaformis CCMP3155]|eukprot:CEM27847.1 unnamed protein product [Vitrella brassicaformis CCMP3155]